MKKILTILFIFCSLYASAQLAKSTGVLYFADTTALNAWGAPVSGYGSEIAKVLSTREVYNWDGSAWVKTVEITQDSGVPSGDPLTDSKLYLDTDTGELYRWSGASWTAYGTGGGGTWGSITGTLSAQTDLQSALDAKSNTGHTHTESGITDLDHFTGADISGSETAFDGWDKDASDDYDSADFNTDFGSKTTTDLTEGTNLYYTEVRVSANTDVAANTAARHDAITIAAGLDYASLLGQEITLNQIDLTTDVTGVLPSGNIGSHNHAATDITSGTFADGRISESSVTQHESALSITESQISDLSHTTVSDAVYGVAWNGNTTEAASKNALYDIINTLASGGDGNGIFTVGNDGGTVSTGFDIVLTDSLAIGAIKFDNDGNLWGLDSLNGHYISSGSDTIALREDLHDAVTIASGLDYASIAGQEITLNQIDLTTDVSGLLPGANIASDLTASQVTDFDTEVSNNSSVVANTAKVSFPGFTSLLADYGFTDNSGNWNLAFGWGDHSTEGYLTGITGESIKDLSDVFSTMTPSDGQALIFDTTNGWQSETLPSGVTDHGLLTGLGDDDHTQYHNDTRADTWLSGKTTDNLTEGSTNLYNVVPAGGTTGQILEKINATDYNVQWTDPASLTEVNDLTASVTWANVPDVNITQSSVTQHEGALSITESQISDLSHYTDEDAMDATSTMILSGTHQLIDISYVDGSDLMNFQVDSDLSLYDNGTSNFSTGAHVTVSDVAYDATSWNGNTDAATKNAIRDKIESLPGGHAAVTIAGAGTYASLLGQEITLNQIDLTTDVTGVLPSGNIGSHNHAATDITSGTFADGRISESSVTQHESALSITESQISDFGTYLTSEVDGSISNEGSLTVGAGTGTTSIINSNTSGSTGVTFEASTGLSISEAGSTITLTNTVTNTDNQTASEVSITDSGTYYTGTEVETALQEVGASLAGKSDVGHTHATADIISGTFADARISESSVTQHEGAITITESQISDLGSYGDVSGPASATDNRIARFDGTTGKLIQTSNIAVTDAANLTGVSDISMTGDVNMVALATVDGVDVSEIVSFPGFTSLSADYSFDDTDDLSEGSTNLYNRVPAGGTTGQILEKINATDYNVQWTDAPSLSEVNDLSSVVTWANVPDANITQSSVTQHEGALSITASQVSDFDTEVSNNSSVTANTAKVTNATHTGDVTGSTALTLQSVAITGQSEVTAVSGDHVLISDLSNGGALRKALASDFFDGNTQLSDEEVQDIVGGMVTGNTETDITVTYQGGDGTIDFAVDKTGDWTGTLDGSEGSDLLDRSNHTGLAAAKDADETVTGSTTLQADDDLVVALEANSYYSFTFFPIVTSNATADIKYAFSGPASSTGWWSARGGSSGTAEPIDGTTSGLQIIGTTSEYMTLVYGIIYTGASSGNLTLLWAQNTSDGVNTILKKGSSLVVNKLN